MLLFRILQWDRFSTKSKPSLVYKNDCFPLSRTIMFINKFKCFWIGIFFCKRFYYSFVCFRVEIYEKYITKLTIFSPSIKRKLDYSTCRRRRCYYWVVVVSIQSPRCILGFSVSCCMYPLLFILYIFPFCTLTVKHETVLEQGTNYF